MLSRARILYIAGPCAITEAKGRDFVIVQGPYRNELDEIADVVLPESTAFESEGTFINAEGRAQLSPPLLEPMGESRPGWQIIGALAGTMEKAGFGYRSATEIRKAIASEVPLLRGLDALEAAAGIVLDEGPAGGPMFLEATAAAGLGPGPDFLCPHPDDYRGLRLDLYNKSLRLVRGRHA